MVFRRYFQQYTSTITGKSPFCPAKRLDYFAISGLMKGLLTAFASSKIIDVHAIFGS
jgi:hypothetical protein